MYAYTLTDNTITITDTLLGEVYTLTRDKNPDAFDQVRALIEDDDLEQAAEVARSARHWVQDAAPELEERDGGFYYKDLPVDPALARLILDRTKASARFMRFLEKLVENPSRRVVEDLYRFIQSCPSITIDQDGYILAFKGVRDDYRDVYSGRFDNSVGNLHEMPRNQVSDDPAHACSNGFHAGSLHYASSYGPKVMLVRIDPRDVVSVPYDHDSQKLRCCRYAVVAEITNPDNRDAVDEQVDEYADCEE